MLRAAIVTSSMEPMATAMTYSARVVPAWGALVDVAVKSIARDQGGHAGLVRHAAIGPAQTDGDLEQILLIGTADGQVGGDGDGAVVIEAAGRVTQARQPGIGQGKLVGEILRD